MIVPKQIVKRKYWQGVGQLVDVRVQLCGQYVYTSIIRKDGESVQDFAAKVRSTLQAFRAVRTTAGVASLYRRTA